MHPHRTILKFAGLFVLYFTILSYPWPGVRSSYAVIYRGMGNFAFSKFGSAGRVRFYPIDRPNRGRMDSAMELLNREAGIGGVVISTSSRFMAYIPTTLVVALTLATPIPWRRRLWALLWGFVLVNLFILLRLLLSLLYEFSGPNELAIFSPGPFLRAALYWCYVLFVGTSVGGFLVPVVIWAAVTIRRKNLSSWIGSSAPRKT